MTIFGPGDSGDTFEVGPGEIVFIPPAYFHYIENIGDNNEDMQFAIFSIMNDQRILVFLGLLVPIQTTF
jgi:oxalate decarboxylase/phosphoglucose isomerase-like protein (cupin superfamily)